MDFLLMTVLLLQVLKGFHTIPAGNYNFVCRDGEEYDMCRSPCEPTCDSIRRNVPQSNCSRPCIAGCFCRNGFVRARDNTCVPPEDCLRPVCPENEVYLDCGSPCTPNCTNLHEAIFCSKPCQKGCFCKANFVRDARGKCVDPKSCTVALPPPGRRQCPINEHYVDCINHCNTCLENPYCSTPYCTPGCDCKPGYFRNMYGLCVTAEECTYSQYEVQEQCGVNEIYTSCVNPCNDCVQRGRCDYEQYYCTPGCDCKHGFFRNERGVCVPERNCLVQCYENEVFLDCGPSCRSTCENYKRLRYHPCKEECVPGCFCTGNFVIGPGGKCIPHEYCPGTKTDLCPPGETFYQCMPTCRTTCRSLSDANLMCSTDCKPGCFCQPGLVRNDEGRCVRPAECPVHPVCPPGEVYYDCIPCPSSCENLNGTCPKICIPGCACERGLVRRRDGRCTRPSNCRTVCGPNQEYRSCATACPPSCDNISQSRICTTRCVRGCFCKLGFVMGPNGRCIRRQACPIRPPLDSDIVGRRAGDDETTTLVPTTLPGQSETKVPKTEKPNATAPETTTTAPSTAPKATDPSTAAAAPKTTVPSTTSSSKTTEPSTSKATKPSSSTTKETKFTTLPASKATEPSTAAAAPKTTIPSTTTSQATEPSTPSAPKVTDAKPPPPTTVTESAKSPATENVTPVQKTSPATNAAETTSGVTLITTEAVSTTLSGNTTSTNSTG